MRLTVLALTLLVSLSLVVSCAPKKKVLTLKDYAKIEAEINLPDPDLNPELSKAVVAKYGFTYEEYREFARKVDKDVKLREELGELKLKEMKKDSKKEPKKDK